MICGGAGFCSTAVAWALSWAKGFSRSIEGGAGFVALLSLGEGCGCGVADESGVDAPFCAGDDEPALLWPPSLARRFARICCTVSRSFLMARAWRYIPCRRLTARSPWRPRSVCDGSLDVRRTAMAHLYRRERLDSRKRSGQGSRVLLSQEAARTHAKTPMTWGSARMTEVYLSACT